MEARRKIPRRGARRREGTRGARPRQRDGGSTTLGRKRARVLARVIRFARAIRISSHEGGYRAVMKHVILSSRRTGGAARARVRDNCAYRRCRESDGDGSAPLRENNVIRRCTIARGRIIEKVRFLCGRSPFARQSRIRGGPRSNLRKRNHGIRAGRKGEGGGEGREGSGISSSRLVD